MAATAGTITLVGNRSGKTISIDMYVPDAVSTFVTFNPTGLATSTSPNTVRIPEDSTIVDISVAGAPTAVGVTLQQDSAPVIGGTLRYANQLSTLANRQKLAVPIRAGTFLAGLQF